MIRNIQAKTLLSSKKEGIDGIRYTMNLYRGCQFGCIYCDSRSTCYGIENFSDILIKENALELLDKELHSKRHKGTIGTGSMNDPYMHIEKKMELTRGAMKLIKKFKFPIHIITKGDLVVRDIDLLKEISKVYAAVSFSITAADDALAKQIEPHAPSPAKRFAAMKKLSNNGIYTGVVLTPVLPFITDTNENIEEIVLKSKQAGAQYILCWLGMTIREGQREYFYNELDNRFPGLKEKYLKRYRNNYSCSVPDINNMQKRFTELCLRENIPTRMKFFKETKTEQISLFG
jgi:DNA repair photolyase